MIRICPKCGDYYADASLAFCLADGTPLANVEPMSESWRKGARFIEAKETARRKQQRKLKRRRVFLRAMTIAVATLVVYVAAVNALIYLRPQPDKDGSDKPSTAATVPVDSSQPATPGQPLPTQKPRPTVTPKPTSTRDAKPAATPTPTPRLSPTPTPTPTPVLEVVCSEADKGRERSAIIERFGAVWRRKIEDERRQIINESLPLGGANGEASLGAIEYTSAFSERCTTASITARYVWQLRINLNETTKIVPIVRRKRFACEKTEGTWRCR